MGARSALVAKPRIIRPTATRTRPGSRGRSPLVSVDPGEGRLARRAAGGVEQDGAEQRDRDAHRAEHHVLPRRLERAARAAVAHQERRRDGGGLEGHPQDPEVVGEDRQRHRAEEDADQGRVPALVAGGRGGSRRAAAVPPGSAAGPGSRTRPPQVAVRPTAPITVSMNAERASARRIPSPRSGVPSGVPPAARRPTPEASATALIATPDSRTKARDGARAEAVPRTTAATRGTRRSATISPSAPSSRRCRSRRRPRSGAPTAPRG